MGIGDWNHDGDELVARAGQWQGFTQWLKAAVVGAQRKADSFEFGDTKNRVTWKEVHQQLQFVYDQLTATVGAQKDNPVPGLPWFDRERG